MNDESVRALAKIFAIQAEVEGMKTENYERSWHGDSLAYDESAFQAMANRLRRIGEGLPMNVITDEEE